MILKKTLHTFKHTFFIILCLIFAFFLYTQPLKSTITYVTSLSKTCVNTFASHPDDSIPLPEKPGIPQETGDIHHLQWYQITTIIGIVGLIVVCSIKCEDE